jgi:lysophospholipase
MKILLSFVLLFSALGLGTPPGIAWPKSILREGNLPALMAEKILPFWNAGKQGTFAGKAGVALPYKAFELPVERAAIVLIPGHLADKMEYREVAYSLTQEGYSVYVYDHRGQGHAPRLAKNPQIAHVDDFQDYIDDLEAFLKQVVRTKAHPYVFGIGSSMGGLIGTRLVQQHPKALDAFVAAVPAYGVQLKGIPSPIVKLWLRFQIALGRANSYAPLQKDGSLEEMRARKELNSYTRWKEELKLRAIDPAFIMGGPSNRLLLGMIEAGEAVMQNAITTTTPILAIEAENELTVLSPRIEKFSELAPHAILFTLPRAYHRIFLEADDIRLPLMTEIYRFLVRPGEVEWYLKRNEPAFAQYAAGLQGESKAATQALEKSSADEKALYRWLTARRQEELNKIYPGTGAARTTSSPLPQK